MKTIPEKVYENDTGNMKMHEIGADYRGVKKSAAYFLLSLFHAAGRDFMHLNAFFYDIDVISCTRCFLSVKQ